MCGVCSFLLLGISSEFVAWENLGGLPSNLHIKPLFWIMTLEFIESVIITLASLSGLSKKQFSTSIEYDTV